MRGLALGCWALLLLAAHEAAAQGTPTPTPPPAPVEIAVHPHPAPLKVGEASALTFYVLGQGGAPMPGLAVHAQASGTDVVAVTEDSPGIYSARLTPSGEGEAPTLFELRLSVGEIQETVSLPVLVARPPPVTVTLDADAVLLGSRERVGLDLDASVPGWPEPALDEIKVRVNVGHVEGLTALGGGKFKAQLVLPASRAPQVGLVAVTVGEGDWLRWGWSRLVMSGRLAQTYEVDAGATVYASVSGRRFGPTRAGPDGKATLTLEVGPGSERVDVEARSAGGAVANATVPLVIPPFPRAVMIAEGLSPAPLTETAVLVFGVSRGGEASAPPAGELFAEGGSFTSTASPAPGVLVARYRAPAQAGRVRLGLKREGAERGALPEPLELEVPPGRPQRLKIKVEPSSLRVDDPPAQVQVQVLDSQGLPADGGRLALDATVGAVTLPSQVAAGTLVAALTPPRDLSGQGIEGAGAVDGEVGARLYWYEGSGPPARLELHPPSLVMDPGRWPQGMSIPARLLDSQGLPIPRRHLNGQVISGQGTLSGGVTDAGGWVSLVFRPAAGMTGAARLRVLVEDLPRLRRDVLVLLVPGGDESFGGPLEVVRPAGPDLVASAPVRVRAGRVRQVQITVQPNDLFVGGLSTATVRVRLLDNQGNPVMDPGMSISAEAGSLDPVEVTPDGVHLAVYHPPPTAGSGTVALSVRGDQEEYAGGTEVFLRERRERLLVSSRVGMITNLRQYVAPMTTMTVLRGLPSPLEGLYPGGGVQYHPFTLSFQEPGGGEEGRQRSDILSLWIGGAYRAQLGPVTAEGAAGLVGAGVFYSTTFADEQRSPTAFVLVPGLRVSLAGELGLGPGGLEVAAAYTRLVAGDLDLGPEGNIGGLSVELGYVVHLR